MAERSILWPAPTHGDGAAAYSMTDLTKWIRHMTASGVHAAYGDELEVTGTASPLTIGYGAAIVDGIPYWTDDPVSLAVPPPVSGTTGHLVVLRADWTAQTVRVALHSSADGVSTFPALTLNEGTVFEVLLAYVSITLLEDITVIDARDFLYYHTMIDAQRILHGAVQTLQIQDNSITTLKIQNNAVTPAKIPDRTRQFMVMPNLGWDVTAGTALVGNIGANYEGMNFLNGHFCRASLMFVVPFDYVSGMTVIPVVHALSSGDLNWDMEIRYGGNLEPTAANYDSVHSVSTAMGSDASIRTQLPGLALSAPAAGDMVSVLFARNGSDVLDTMEASLLYGGVIVSYTADY
jgi:hypothetical protein